MKRLIHLCIIYDGIFTLDCPEYEVYATGDNIPEAFERLGEKINLAITDEERKSEGGKEL